MLLGLVWGSWLGLGLVLGLDVFARPLGCFLGVGLGWPWGLVLVSFGWCWFGLVWVGSLSLAFG